MRERERANKKRSFFMKEPLLSYTENNAGPILMTTLTRLQLIKHLNEKLSLPSPQSAAFLEATLNMITLSLSEQETVKIMGFCSFIPHHKRKRIGRNPRTKKDVLISPRSVVLFKPSSQLRKKVR